MNIVPRASGPPFFYFLYTSIMNYLIGFVIGFAIAWFVKDYTSKESTTMSPDVRRSTALDYLQGHGEITNDIYEQMTGISNAQAERDLDALEKEGILVQVGKTGRSVKYRLK